MAFHCQYYQYYQTNHKNQATIFSIIITIADYGLEVGLLYFNETAPPWRSLVSIFRLNITGVSAPPNINNAVGNISSPATCDLLFGCCLVVLALDIGYLVALTSFYTSAAIALYNDKL